MQHGARPGSHRRMEPGHGCHLCHGAAACIIVAALSPVYICDYSRRIVAGNGDKLSPNSVTVAENGDHSVAEFGNSRRNSDYRSPVCTGLYALRRF